MSLFQTVWEVFFGPPDPFRLLKRGDIGAIVRLTKHHNPGVRCSAGQALLCNDWVFNYSAAELVDRIRQTGHDPFDVLRTIVAEPRKGRDCDPDAPASNIVGDPREQAAAALGELGHQKAVEVLTPRLADHNLRVRLASASSLARLGDSNGLNLLLAALGYKDLVARWEAARHLASLGDTRFVKPLLQVLTRYYKESEYGYRWPTENYEHNLQEATALIAKLGPRGLDAVGVILDEGLSHHAPSEHWEWSVVREAASVLAELGDERVVAKLSASDDRSVYALLEEKSMKRSLARGRYRRGERSRVEPRPSS
jgi:HEAT repeat protein